MNKVTHLLTSILLLGAAVAWGADVYTIYPIPQKQIARQGRVNFSKEVTLVCDAQIDKATRARAKQVLQEAGLTVKESIQASSHGSHLYLSVAGDKGQAEQKAMALGVDQKVLATEGKFDRHLLHLFSEQNAAQVLIMGENSDAVFYGLASLEQMFSRGTKDLPCVTLNDYADQQSRGLVEGYYGYPYSVAVKKDLMRFMMRMKMNTYMYGAKSDVYHSADWEKPYPIQLSETQRKNGLLTQSDIQDIAATSAATKVNFIWAIHPGNDFVGSSTVVNRIMSKFDSMYQLGVRQFAIFVDDVGVPKSEADCNTNAARLTAVQKAIDDKWNTTTATPESRVKPLHFVPQVYTLSWVGVEDRKRFYKALQSCPPKITIYITGNGVWTVPNSEDLAVTKRELGRNVAWWWNYPCNDNADEQVYPSDMYTNFMEMRAVNEHSRMPKLLQNGQGIVSNPMQQGEVSKTALFSVADYAWNNSAFDNKKSWEASFAQVLSTPEKREAYKTLIPYIRWNDPQEMQAAIAEFKRGRTAKIKGLLDKLEPALQTMQGLSRSSVESEQLLYKDLTPWLAKLQAMIRATQNMITLSQSKDRAIQWENYVQADSVIKALATDEAFTAYALEGLGHSISVSKRQCSPAAKYFFPFMNYLREEGLGNNFFGKVAKEVEWLTSTPNVRGNAFVSNGKVYMSMNNATIPANAYVGFALREAVRPERIEAQIDWLAQHNVLYSANGKDWKRLTATQLLEQDWVKYIVYFNNTGVDQTLSTSSSTLSVILPKKVVVTNIVVPVKEAGNGGSNSPLGPKAIVDGNPNTFFASNKDQAQGDTYQLTLAKKTEVQDVRIYFGTLNGDHLQAGRVEASADGNHWETLRLKGHNTVTGGVNQATDYAPNVKYVDFVGQVKNAKYVRLVVTEAPTKKWLRLYDIQINQEQHRSLFAPVAVDAQGARLETIIDKKAQTTLETAKGGSLVYEFQQIEPLSELQVYWQPKGQTLKVELWDANSKTWKATGEKLQTPLARVDLSQQPNATKMRLSWVGHQVPAIHEMLEVTDAQARSILAHVSSPRVSSPVATSLYIYDLQGNLLRKDGNTKDLPAGVYIVGGRKVQLQ